MSKDALRKWILAVGRTGIMRKAHLEKQKAGQGFSESWLRTLKIQQASAEQEAKG